MRYSDSRGAAWIGIEIGVVFSCIPECKEVQRVQGAIGADAPQHLRFGPGSADAFRAGSEGVM